MLTWKSTRVVGILSLLLHSPCAVAQQQQQQQEGPPILVKLLSKAVSSSYKLAHLSSKHPKETVSIVGGVACWLYLLRQLKTSGIVLWACPHLSVAPPSDEYVFDLLSIAEEIDISNPYPGATAMLSTQIDDDIISDVRDGSELVDDLDAETDELIDDEEEEDVQVLQLPIEKLLKKCAREKVLLGTGATLYRRAAVGLLNLDQFDEVQNAEFIVADTGEEDSVLSDIGGIDGAMRKHAVGATIGLMFKGFMNLWCFSPLRITYKTSSQPPLHYTATDSTAPENEDKLTPPSTTDDSTDIRGDEIHENVYKTSIGLSTVRGSGWEGEWRYSVTFHEDTGEVFFEACVFKNRKTIIGHTHTKLLKNVLQSMEKRAQKDKMLLSAREAQRSKFSTLSAEKNREKREKKRDRTLHPENYERKHVWMDDERNAGGRPARWGEARRSSDIRLKGR